MDVSSSISLQDALINWTVKNSGHENHRCYIGLSGIADCSQSIYDRYMHGQPANGIDGHLKTRISYELEADLIQRLKNIQTVKPAQEISLYDGLVRGHPDGIIGRDLLEIKTVAEEQHFPTEMHLPRRVYWQVQAYLHYTGLKVAQVVYLARANGAICVITSRYNPSLGALIVEKIEDLVVAVKEYRRPACSCGKCEVKP